MREHRYYMRVFERATTSYWGIVLAFGLQLPAPAPPAPPPGNAVPAVAPAPTPTPPLYGLAWTVLLDGTASDGLAASASHVLVVSRDEGTPSVLEARARTTGARTWVSATRGWQTIAAHGDTVVGVANQRLEALEAASGRSRWSTTVTGVAPRLTLADEWLVLATSTEIAAYGVRAGGRAWRHDITTPVSAAAAIDPGAVTVGFDDATLAAYDLSSGTPRWRVATGSVVISLAADGTAVYAGLANGSLCAYRARDGRTAWCRALGIPVAGRPLAVDARLLVVLRDNTLRVFDRHNGTMRQQRPLGFRPSSGVEVAGDRLVVSLASAAFLVLGREGRALATIAATAPATAAQLLGTVVGRDGQLLASLTIPAGGRLTLTAYQPSAPAAPASAPVVARPAR